MILLSLLLLFQPTDYRVHFQPFTVQDESNPDTYLSGFRQIETNGQDLFLALVDTPTVLQFKSDGTFVRRIGKKGEGPGELGFYRPWAMAVQGDRVWILKNNLKSVNYYEQGEFLHQFKPVNYQLYGSRVPAYPFGFNNEHIVLQAYPRSRHLANVYDYSGKVVKQVGKILPINPEWLRVNPAVNNTMWVHDEQFWYCLFVHRPILRKFDAQFNQIKEFELEGPEIAQFEEVFEKNEKDPNWTFPKPHFTDMQSFGNDLLIMSNGVLYQVAKETGRVLSRTGFWAPSEEDNQRMVQVGMALFAVTDARQIYIGTSILYQEYDLWTAKLPFASRANP